MRCSLVIVIVWSVSWVLWVASSSVASVVNIDMEAGVAADTTHVGDDGPLSTSGGTLWTSVIAGASTSDLPDEFGSATSVDVVFVGPVSGTTFSDPGINNLQDSGTGGMFQIVDLVPGQAYDIAAYVGANGGFLLTDAGGTNGYFYGDPGADGWGLPGSQGNGGDYFLATGVIPFDTGGGVYGVQFQVDGAVTGLQITQPIPEPSGLLILALGGLAFVRAGWRGRR